MKLILKYLKPYAALVGVALVLLFAQVACDLTLPNLMSDIVNVGIQSGGLSGGAPDAVNADTRDLLRLFMTGEEQAAFDSAYTPKQKTDGTAKELERYPALETETVYVKTPQDGGAAVDAAYENSAYAFLLFVQEAAERQGTSLTTDDMAAEGLSTADLEQVYDLLPMLQAMPAGSFSDAMAKAAADDGMMREQVGIALKKVFYQALGTDMSAIQRSYILGVGLRMLAVALLAAACALLNSLIASVVAARVAKNMRHDTFSKVQHFSSGDMDKFSTASLITRSTNDIQQVHMLVTMGLRILCYAPLMGIGGVIFALNKSVSLSWIIVLAVVFLAGIAGIVLTVVMPKFKVVQKLTDRLNLVSRESLSGMMVIRAFGNEAHEEKRFEKANGDLSKTNLFIQRVMSFIMPCMTLLMNVTMLLIIWFGGKAIAGLSMQIGDMMAFMQYSMHIMMSFFMIAMMFVFIPRALVSANRIQEVLDTKFRVQDPAAPVALENPKGEITFEGVSFRYEAAEEDVLSDISFTAKPGETTAFIGSTGSGKSTLINLIPRFYDVTGGRILLDGVDIREISQEQLRAAIGYVPQKGLLFSGTVKSNLEMGKGDASEEELQQALDISQATDFVMADKRGTEMPISQGGGNVSGGQRQRLSIARALIKKPALYIFDDSFSALDFKTDAALRRALKQDTETATTLIVAQRVSTIMNAEQIIVLDDGRMVGIGTHSTLLKSCPQYREIAESQMQKEELA